MTPKHPQSPVICVDMDAFFASVEQRKNPALRGKPIAVIGSAKRTVVTTSSYEARKYGVKTGMSVAEALRECPNIRFVVGDNASYTHTARGLAEIFRSFTPDVEVYSIDEAFLDVSTTAHLFGGPMEIGRRIKARIRERFGLAATIGIGPNILIAKLVSDMAKPDGLRMVLPSETPALLRDLPVDELWGIGKKTKHALGLLGIRTCGELGDAPLSLLRNKFGITGETLGAMGRGELSRPVCPDEGDPKSIGHSRTLPRDIWDRPEMEAHILELAEMVGRRARRNGLSGRTVSLAVRYKDFETFSRQRALPYYTDDSHSIFDAAMSILDGVRLRESVRLLGVTLSSIRQEPPQEILLIEERKRKSLVRAMDGINDRYGEHSIVWAGYLDRKTRPGVISPAWRPDGTRFVDVR